MQELRLNRHEAQYMYYINSLLKLDSNDKDVKLIYDIKFLTPFIGVLVASFLNSQGYHVISEINDEGKQSASYAKNNNFFHFAESDKNINNRNTEFSGSFTPIMKTPLDTYHRAEDNIVESVSKKISNVLSAGNDEVYRILEYIISELFRNIPEHSQCFEGWHCSQQWVHDDYIEAEIALVDYGIGFKESLNFAGKFQASNDVEAIRLALEPGITAGIIDKSHLREGEKTEYLNSGYGLYAITELCKALSGQYVIVSKGAIATKKGIEYLKGNLVFPGTAIKIKLRIPNNLSYDTFHSTLQKIIKKGEHSSKSIEGAINIASPKSRSMGNYN
ncbi:hypothetical protein [Streptococcus gallolyticus]|uniref:hypothetical protein n=2 Tax=Streptococcus gallolyticus TaxID=315405 RepID=UPI0022846594|nr:hypothetical protein [Streptococcus gallolyticus]MCY7184587.1 hypothetical protein [Streptococcus gallolyticus subsp. gallolyticus]MCY7188813.1 hypothetical protein [Streptococcus gallolyticus subsp. gallolyticus]